MLITQKDNSVVVSGEFETNSFSIIESPEAFEILSKKLYSNGPRAIIRELSCNAYDAHVAAGNEDKPFDVHLPTWSNPVFSIRDYGIGMTHQEVMKLYTSYFMSTKRTSNDYVGCLGLGSKSPFSYTDSFAVTSFKDGVKREYNMYIGGNRKPQVSLLAESMTEEPNGLLVSLNISKFDYTTFASEATQVYTYFKTKPKMTGYTITIPKIEPTIIGNGWYSTKSTSDSWAIMGNVAYPIVLKNFGANVLSVEHKKLLESGKITLIFNIGDIEIAPSREQLSYDERTQNNIIDKLNQVLLEVKTQIYDKVQLCLTDYEKILCKEEVDNHYSRLVDSKTYSEYFKGVSQTIDLSGATNLPLIHRLSIRANKLKTEQSSYVYVSKNTIFFEDDATLSGRRIKQYLGNKLHWGSEYIVYLIKFDGQSQKRSFLQKIGSPTQELFTKTSSLDKPAPVSRGGYRTTQCYEYNPITGSLTESTVKTSDEILFVRLYRNRIVDKNGRYLCAESRFCRWAPTIFESIGKTSKRICLLRSSQTNKKYDSTKWVDFYDYAKTQLSALIEQKRVSEVYSNKGYMDLLSSYGYLVTTSETRDNVLTRFVSRLRQFEKIAKDNQCATLIKLAGELGVEIQKKDKTIEKEQQEILQKYPLLEALDIGYHTDKKTLANIWDYIDMIDNKEKNNA